MSDLEILEKAILRATENGWLHQDNHNGKVEVDFQNMAEESFCYVIFGRSDKPLNAVESFESISDIIFRHDFAQAFWGSQPYVMGQLKDQHYEGKMVNFQGGFPHWEYQLMRLSIEKDPLKYLEKYL